MARLFVGGIVSSGGGIVKLLTREELAAHCDAAEDAASSCWRRRGTRPASWTSAMSRRRGRTLARFRAAHPDMELERARDLA